MSYASVKSVGVESQSLVVRRVVIAVGVLFSGLFLVAGFCCFYWHWGDVLMGVFPPCIFHAATGLQCPSCGLQRALFSLVHGNIIEALRFNALVVFSMIFCLWFMVKTAWRYALNGVVKLPEIKSMHVYLIMLVVLTFAIARNF